MLKNIQSFFLGLLRASRKQLKELLLFALSIALHIPSVFAVFYFVFILGMEDKTFNLGSSSFNVQEIHILLIIACFMFFWIGTIKFLKTKLKEENYTLGQIVVRSLLKVRHVALLAILINLFMLKFTLMRINTYVVIIIVCFFLSVLFESKYNKSANVKWRDK